MTLPANRRTALHGALVAGSLALVLSLARLVFEPALAPDFDQWHFAARAMLHGENPYRVIGPGGEFEWAWPLFYPLPTVVFTMPFAWLPVDAARVAFCTVSGAVFGYAICRDGYWRLPALLSAAFLIAVWRVQWSLLITAVYFVPAAALVLLAKPNIGAAMVAGVRSRRQLLWLVASGAVLLGVSLVLSPRWPLDWLAALRTKPFVSAPVMNPGGFLLPLALVRWRRPEARLFAALACVPQTPALYELVPLFVVPLSLRGTTALALLTSVLHFTITASGPFPSFYQYSHRLEQLAIFIVWLPMLVVILRRPNVWTDPPAPQVAPGTWRERVAALPRLDAWLLLATAAMFAFFVWATFVTRQA
jgi:hypothetical protein